MLMSLAHTARADDQQMQQETKAAMSKLHEAEAQLKEIEAKRAETLRKIEESRVKLEQAEREAQTAREKLKTANTVLQNIEEERTHATRQLIDASVSTTAEVGETDGKAYTVTGLIIEYAQDHPAHLAPEELLDQKVELLRTLNGFVSPRPGDVNSRVRLMDIPDLTEQRFYASALRKMCAGIVQHFNEANLIGVYVSPDPSQIDIRTGDDFRPAGQTTLKIVVRTAIIANVRTVAGGERFGEGEQRINNPAHARLLRQMPLQTAIPGDFGSGALLQKDALNDYIYRANRHPGRRVDVALSSAGEETPGGVAVDLMIAENKPWTVYYQLSNTGTDATSTWRHRFGLVHNQLTNNDDVFSLDYITGGFDEVNSVVASYERPWFDSDTVRWKVHGLWSEFTASDVGLTEENFQGSEWSVGAEISANIWQEDSAFLDVVGGVVWRSLYNENTLLGPTNHTNLFTPHVGLRYERGNDRTGTQTRAAVSLKFNLPSIADTDTDFSVYSGGKIDVDSEYAILAWNMTHSFFLEPLLNRAAWEDISTPESSTLVHELFVAFKGQSSFDKRLFAQEEQTVGGLYTVRGYRESDQTGDSALIGTLEYRYHVPRAFDLQPEPGTLFGKPFKWAPQTAYGRADWDMVLKTFLDVGRTLNAKSQLADAENNETLIGAGVGVDVIFKRNISVRADWGFALNNTPTTDAGHNVVHIVATLLY